MKKEIFDMLMKIIMAKDKITAEHSQRVAYYSALIAHRLGLKKNDVKRIYYMGLLHDIGKIGIPDEILKNDDKLTEKEMDIIKEHVLIGAQILDKFDVDSYKNIYIGAKYHQEHYDGNGYEEGLSKEEIPYEARIIAVADATDAMLSFRTYKKALTINETINELEKKSGSQFDPEIAKIMIMILKENPNIHEKVEKIFYNKMYKEKIFDVLINR